MKNKKRVKIGMVGTGAMAKSHVYALSNLKFYYNDCPQIDLEIVSSSHKEHYECFGRQFGFSKAVSMDEFWDHDFDCLFITSPNETHYEHLVRGLESQRVKSIYVEKPVVCFPDQVNLLRDHSIEKTVQTGFQFLQMSAIKKARELFPTLGRIIHFEGHYLHSGYLEKSYRAKKSTRLLPAPIGGVTCDLASHVFSLLISFFGPNLVVKNALKSGSFDDVVDESELCVQILLKDLKTSAIGSLCASRISSGSNDELSFRIVGEKGTLKFSTLEPDSVYYYTQGQNWQKIITANHYEEGLDFPSAKVPVGHLRSLIHAHYLFLTQKKTNSSGIFVPDLVHGLQVQNLIDQVIKKIE